MIKKKKVIILQRMEEVRTKKMEIEVNQDKIDYVTYAYSEEVTFWRKAASKKVSTERRKRINRLSTFKSFFNSESKDCKDSKQ